MSVASTSKVTVVIDGSSHTSSVSDLIMDLLVTLIILRTVLVYYNQNAFSKAESLFHYEYRSDDKYIVCNSIRQIALGTEGTSPWTFDGVIHIWFCL